MTKTLNIRDKHSTDKMQKINYSPVGLVGSREESTVQLHVCVELKLKILQLYDLTK